MMRICCDPVPPKISQKLGGGFMIYCPICGITVYGPSLEEAKELWNDYRDSMDLDEI